MQILAKQRLQAAWFTSSSGRIEFEIPREEAARCGSGSNDAVIKHLSKQPHIAQALAKIKPEELKEELREYGAWDDEELEDHKQNLQRILWIACHDINDSDEEENP